MWERVGESGTGGVLANPSLLIAAECLMLALAVAFHSSWAFGEEAFMFVLAADLLLIVSLSTRMILQPYMLEQKISRLPHGCGRHLPPRQHCNETATTSSLFLKTSSNSLMLI